MGSWGYGNFDSDGALNMLAMWMNKIIGNIRETFALDSEDSLYERHGENHIVANVDILTTLCEHYNTFPDLELEEISKWKQDYLNTYDHLSRHVTRLDDKVDLKQRREIIADTFDRFYRFANQFYEEETE